MTSSPRSSGLSPASSERAKNRPREILAWAMYDWANSAYSTLQITILVAYLKNYVLPGKAGNLAYGWTIGTTMFIAALLSPIAGAMADAHGNKRVWLACTTLLGAAASALMFFGTPAWPWMFVVLFWIANLNYELAQGFYNAFLPEIADDAYIGRVSAWGFGLGYIGGGVALLMAIAIISWGGALGLPDDTGVRLRLGLLLMGVWWGLFSLPTFLGVHDRPRPNRQRLPFLDAVRRAFSEVRHTLSNLRRYRMLAIFLVGFLIFNDGVQTVITQASAFAIDVLDMHADELARVVLLIQFLALPGALAVGWLADRLGQKNTLSLCLGIWVAVLVGAYFVSTKREFWIMAIVVAMVMGGTQSVSRTIMGLMTPEAHSAEFFGFFNLSGKATSMVGPPLYSTIMALTGNAHLAIVSLLGFFIVGWAVILPLDVRRGQQEARASTA